MPVRPSSDIDASPLSVGFEVLDRRRFDPHKAYDYVGRLGVKWARCQTGWNRCEQRPGAFTFGWLDDVVDSLRRRGVQPWFNLGYGNKLYTPEKPDDVSVGWAPVFRDQARQAWRRFVRRLAEHFAGRVRHWEIWNEPNIAGFWKPHKPRAEDYVRLISMTVPEIQAAIPDAVIVGGAFAGVPLGYAEACFEAGLARWIHRLSFHPYRPRPEANYESDVGALRRLTARYDDRIKLWQGENGCPSQGGEQSTGALSQLPWDEMKQAKWLLRRILTDLRLKLELTSYFHTVDLVGYRGKTNFKGLLRGRTYEPKPAYFAYQSLCTLFDRRTERAEAERSSDGAGEAFYDAAFVREGRLLYAWWWAGDLFRPPAPRRVTLRLAFAGAALEQPVLVDPLSQRIYDARPLVRVLRRRRRSEATLTQVPLLDRPLVLADRAAVGV